MPVVNGYCTEQELRTWMSDPGSVLPSAIIQDAINATSRMIDNYCGRRFWKDLSPTTRRYQVTENDIAWIEDISSTDDLVIKTDEYGDQSFSTTWLDTDYEMSPYNEEVDVDTPHAFYRIHAIGNKQFPVNSRLRTLQVTGTFGWTAIPDQIHQACLMKSNILVIRKDSPYGLAGFSEFGVVRITRTEDPEVTRLLGPFMKSPLRAI